MTREVMIFERTFSPKGHKCDLTADGGQAVAITRLRRLARQQELNYSTLARWLCEAYGPNVFYLGGKVSYQFSDIEKFVEAEKAKAEWGSKYD